MPIKWTWKKLPVDEQGKAYDTLEAFQAATISDLTGITEDAAVAIVAHKSEVIEALTITEDARPAARGMKKPRKAKPAPEPELLPAHAIHVK